MTGLLIKDYYTLFKQAKIYILLILIFAVLPGETMTGFAIVYAAMLPVTALAYDERAKWDSLAAMMPYSPKSIVLSKYILGYICIIASSIFAFVVKLILGTIKNTVLGPETYFSVIFIALLSVIILAIVLPLMFKFGVEKGRIAFIILIVIFTLTSVAFAEKAIMFLSTTQIDFKIFVLMAVVLTIAISSISVMISVALYKRKSF